MRRVLHHLSFVSPFLFAASVAAQVAVTSVRIDGEELDLRSPTGEPKKTLRLPAGVRDIEFSMSARAITSRKPYILRYKLEGYDPDWVDAYSAMRLVIRTLDASGRIIAAIEERADHASPGWKGSVQASEFSPARLETVAPDRAARVQVWCVSGGPEYTTGVFAFRNVRLKIGQPGTPAYREITFSTDVGSDLDQPLGAPADWRRDGSRPQMAQVVKVGPGEENHALVLDDYDPEAFAAWLTPLEKCPIVAAGEKIVAEWDEAHYVGQGAGAVLSYRRLPPGNYWLRVSAVGVDGTPYSTSTPEASLNFVVLPPIWYRVWFWLLIGGTVSAGAFFIARQLTRRRMQRQVDRLERQHLLERERTRIARDIHDDLGTSLTQISLLSESARKHAKGSPEVMTELDRICASARESVQAMDEIVWAADPENDSLDELATYISGFAQDLLNAVGVRCRLEMPMQLPDWPLSAELRHNVFLSFKEALNNALKHGRPSEVKIVLDLRASGFSLLIEDNGAGFNVDKGTGHGLSNMRNRLQKVGGDFAIESAPGKGTRVRLSVPMEAKV